MTEYTISVNGKQYELNESVRESIEERARLAYSGNSQFSCWWSVARKENYSDEVWEENIHENGDPILTIETQGSIVPWEDLDQLEAQMDEFPSDEDNRSGEDKDLDNGNGTKLLDRDDSSDPEEIFGRSHFTMTPRGYDEAPSPDGNDPGKLPPKPEQKDGVELMVWVPKHPDIDHTWSTGEAIVPTTSWVEWNVQKRADQPIPSKEKPNAHDRFESLCRIHDCEIVGEYTVSDEVPDDTSGQVERKGESAYEDGRYGGGWWNV